MAEVSVPKESVRVDLIPLHCATCGVLFGINHAFCEFAQNDTREFHCPNGHPNKFLLKDKSWTQAIEELRAEVARLEAALARSQDLLAAERERKSL